MALKALLLSVWRGMVGGLGTRADSTDPVSGQTNYGLFVGREERARLESLPPLLGPMTGDLGMASPPDVGEDG